MRIEQEERSVEGRSNGLIVAYRPKGANAKSMPRVGLPPTGGLGGLSPCMGNGLIVLETHVTSTISKRSQATNHRVYRSKNKNK